MIARKLSLPPPELDEDGIEYPDSDGKPLGETGYHVNATLELKQSLEFCFGPRRKHYVAADMFLYYERGNPKANRAPDVMVIKDVGRHERRSFKTWVEGAVPNTIIEAVSRKTFRQDTEVKPVLYARLGVKEYFLFDPLGESRLKPRFQGFRLSRGQFVPMKPEADGGFTSTELGLRLVPEGDYLRVINLKTGKPVLFGWELGPACEAFNLLVEEERHRVNTERHRAEAEQQRAEAERQRADSEKRRADALAAELDRLRKRGKRE